MRRVGVSQKLRDNSRLGDDLAIEVDRRDEAALVRGFDQRGPISGVCVVLSYDQDLKGKVGISALESKKERRLHVVTAHVYKDATYGVHFQI